MPWIFFQQTQTRPIQFNGSYLHIQCLVSKKILDHESFFLMPSQKILRIWAKLWTYTTWIESVLPAGEARMKLRFGSDERFLRQLVDEALNEMRTEAYWNTEFTFFLKTRVLLEKIFLGVFNIVSVHINMADGFVRSFTISNHILGRSQIWDHYRFGQLIPTHPNWTPFVITSGLFCFGRMLSRWVQLSQR